MILLDTHALLWLSLEPRRLSKAATAAIGKAARTSTVAISAISLWELAWLARAGRIAYSGRLQSFLAEVTARVVVLPITLEIAASAVELPAHYPRDPSDRLIGATAICEAIPLVTRDEAIRGAGVLRTIW